MRYRHDFIDWINKNADGGIGIEVGVRYGVFSLPLLNSKLSKVYLLDPWEYNVENPSPADSFNRVASLVNKFPKGEMIKGYSPQEANRFEDNYFDFVFIDALHDYDSVIADMRGWYSKVKTGGLFCGHDYSPKWPGVIQAAKDFFTEIGRKFQVTTDIDDDKEYSWYLVK